MLLLCQDFLDLQQQFVIQILPQPANFSNNAFCHSIILNNCFDLLQSANSSSAWWPLWPLLQKCSEQSLPHHHATHDFTGKYSPSISLKGPKFFPASSCRRYPVCLTILVNLSSFQFCFLFFERKNPNYIVQEAGKHKV